MTGFYKPDEGEIILDGAAVELISPLDAFRRGISVVHQHPGLFGDLTIAENIFIGHMPVDKLGRLDHTIMQSRAAELLELVGLDCDPFNFFRMNLAASFAPVSLAFTESHVAIINDQSSWLLLMDCSGLIKF